MGRLARRLKAEGVAEVHRVAFLRAMEAALALEGLVIVPRVATADMCMAQGNPSYPTREIWNAMVKESQR